MNSKRILRVSLTLILLIGFLHLPWAELSDARENEESLSPQKEAPKRAFDLTAQARKGPASLQEKKEKPKVMVLIDEKIMGVFGTTGSEELNQAETTLVQKFSEMGFNVVDPATVKANITRDKALRMLEGDDRVAAAAGLQHGAQIAVIGKAVSKNAGGKLYGTQMQSIQAVVTAKALRTDDGRVIASGSEQAVKAHIDEVRGGALAIQEASEKLGEILTSKILERWKEEARGGSQAVTLVISNLVSYRHLSFIVDFLEAEVEGVADLQQRSYNAGVAEIGLDYSGRLRDLGKFLAMKNFTGFRLELTNFTQNRIDLRVVLEGERPAPPAKMKSEVRVEAGHEMTLVVSNLGSYRHLGSIMDFLEKEVQGVKNLRQRAFKQGVAELGLEFAGQSRDLIRALAMKNFTGFRLEPATFTQDRIDLKVVLEGNRSATPPRKR